MQTDGSDAYAVTLLRAGRSDEDVERLTGLALLQVIVLRARMATEPSAMRTIMSYGALSAQLVPAANRVVTALPYPTRHASQEDT